MKIMINNQLLIQKEKIPLRYRKAENHKFMYSSQFNNKKQSSIQLWKKQGFIQIGYLSYLSILVKIINSGNEVPHIDIQCDNQSFDIQLYKDSIQILTLLLEKITQKFNNNNNNNNHNDSDNDNNNSNSNNSSDYDDNE
ncbi:hypothetical protein K502DRAFT_133732 [Neoconidiobolus thromboides FSU 785]|nr:hypothetical protein K502DRAFT_133732 [Neoconidiobolus thromboides FSU 785]